MEKRKYAILAAVAFAGFAALISVADRFLPCYYESTGTFFYSRAFLSTILSAPTGIFDLVMRFFGQFFINPAVGVAVLSLMLCGCAVMGVKAAEKFSGRFLVAGAVPSVVVCMLLFYRNRMFVALPMLAAVEAVLLLIPYKRHTGVAVSASGGKRSVILQLALFALAVGVSAPLCIRERNEFLKEQSCLARQGRWTDIIEGTGRGRHAGNLVFQNYANLALAQKGQLSKKIYRAKDSGNECFFITPDRSPELGTMLSDIYLSIGQVAAAQRHAFEANESYRGYSPRLLQTLVKTNIALGNGAVAMKYVNMLKQTLFYRGWAKKYEAICNGTKTTQEMKMLQKCASIPNYFTQYFREDIEIADILLVCPENRVAQQYFTALQHILSDSVQ